MAKDTYYFSHDYNARNDPKIRKLISVHGMIGYGIFWAIVEDLYQNANALPTDYDLIAFDMRTECDIVKSIVNDFELFIIDGNEFGSLAVERRLCERDEKSGKARESAFKRWNKNKNDANALPTHCEPNAIKERKGKEIKVNKIEMAKSKLNKLIADYSNQYDKELIQKFYDYWTEPTKSGTKCKYELERTWDTGRRLARWFENQDKFNKPIQNGTRLLQFEPKIPTI